MQNKQRKKTYLALVIFAIASLGAIGLCSSGQIISGIILFVVGVAFMSIWVLTNRSKSKVKQNSYSHSQETNKNNSAMRAELAKLIKELKNLEGNKIRIQTTIDEKTKQITSKEASIIKILAVHNLASDSNEREINSIINQLTLESMSVQDKMKNIISERETLRQSVENIQNRQRELDNSKSKMTKLLDQKKILTKELFEKVIALEILNRANLTWLENGGYNSNKVASYYLKMMTCGKWDSIDSNTYEISSSITGDCMPVVKLSRSTTQQLFLAIRMSVLQSPECLHKTTPVICDDILVDFDETRQKSAIRALFEFTKYRQVIMFTANKNVVQFAQNYQDCNCIEL